MNQRIDRLGEDEAAAVIRRALEIQGEPGTVTTDELREAARELRIDQAALEQALAERLNMGEAPAIAAQPMLQQRTDLFRIWQSGTTPEETEKALLAVGPRPHVWFSSPVSRTRWASRQRFGLCPGEIVAEQVGAATALVARVGWWPAVVCMALSWPLSIALVAFMFRYPSDRLAVMLVFALSIGMSASLGMWVRWLAVRAAKAELDAIEQRLRGVLR